MCRQRQLQTLLGMGNYFVMKDKAVAEKVLPSWE